MACATVRLIAVVAPVCPEGKLEVWAGLSSQGTSGRSRPTTRAALMKHTVSIVMAASGATVSRTLRVSRHSHPPYTSDMTMVAGVSAYVDGTQVRALPRGVR